MDGRKQQQEPDEHKLIAQNKPLRELYAINQLVEPFIAFWWVGPFMFGEV